MPTHFGCLEILDLHIALQFVFADNVENVVAQTKQPANRYRLQQRIPLWFGGEVAGQGMIEKIKRAWTRFYWDFLTSSSRQEFISERIRWSLLAKIGRAPAMQLTVLVPLIGMLLIFNEQTSAFLKLSPVFLSDLGIAGDDTFSLSTLYYTYFGLCFLGIGSIIFALFCPEEISQEPHQMRYVFSTQMSDAPVLAKDNLQTVLNIYFDNINDQNRNESVSKPEYPDDLVGDFHSLILEMYQSSDFGEHEFSDESDEDADEQFPEIMTPTGYFDMHEFANFIHSNVRISWHYSIPFRDQAPKFAKDISFVKYRSLDLSKYRIRKIAAFIYVLGFATLSVPTAKTFVLLAKSVIVTMLI